MKNVQHSTFNVQPSTTMCSRRHWMWQVESWMLSVPKTFLLFVVRVYRWTVSPTLVFLFGPGGGCRFTPCCSQYAMDAIRAQGALKGSWLAFRRICRCHPWGDGGHDPAPTKEFRIPDSEFRI